jgi:hypothetical protein
MHNSTRVTKNGQSMAHNMHASSLGRQARTHSVDHQFAKVYTYRCQYIALQVCDWITVSKATRACTLDIWSHFHVQQTSEHIQHKRHMSRDSELCQAKQQSMNGCEMGLKTNWAVRHEGCTFLTRPQTMT